MRDRTLDKSKGLAIILVVVGHTIQSKYTNFDQNMFFRVIYSFHMPFFVLLSGASASFWVRNLNKDEPFNIRIRILSSRLGKSAAFLLSPFFFWTIFSYYYNDSNDSFFHFIREVLVKPDLSLWFLPSIFWCTTYLTIGLFILESIISKIGQKHRIPNILFYTESKILIIFAVWIVVRTKIPTFFALGMTNFFHGGLFFYFLVGVLLQANIKLVTRRPFLVFNAVAFIILVPFWSRLGVNNFESNVPDFLNQYYVGAIFTISVALFGSLSCYIGMNIYSSKLPNWASSLLNLFGVNTLGIYAIHIYLISWRPYVFAPILISVIFSLCIQNVPLFSILLLGKPKKRA